MSKIDELSQKEIIETEPSQKTDMPVKMDATEYRRLAFQLEGKHVIFNKFFTICKPFFTTKIPTACVAFDKIGDCVNFLINPKFWAESCDERKQFIISHECMHVILNHGYRMNNLSDEFRPLANISMDLVVNYLLVDRFGFKREIVDPKGQLCWVDTILKSKDMVLPEDKSFEHYFNKLKEHITYVEGSPMDDHENLGSFNCDQFIKKFQKQVNDCSKNEVESLKELLDKSEKQDPKETDKSILAGKEAGNLFKKLVLSPPVYKKKWETIIRGICKRALTTIEIEQWARKHRRMTNVSSDCFLPSDMEIDEVEKSKAEIYLFMDTSGSCVELGERFVNAARSIPPYRFHVRAFCFDTKTYPLDLKTGTLSGFGGTCFQCIDQMIRREVANGHKYPDNVVIVTDGYGTPVNPEMPKRWHWLLTSGGSTDCIPSDCKIYDLKDFE